MARASCIATRVRSGRPSSVLSPHAPTSAPGGTVLRTSSGCLPKAGAQTPAGQSGTATQGPPKPGPAHVTLLPRDGAPRAGKLRPSPAEQKGQPVCPASQAARLLEGGLRGPRVRCSPHQPVPSLGPVSKVALSPWLFARQREHRTGGGSWTLCPGVVSGCSAWLPSGCHPCGSSGPPASATEGSPPGA